MQSAFPAVGAQAAAEVDGRQALLILFRSGVLVVLLAAGWAADVAVFAHFRIDYAAVLGIAKDEVVGPQRLCCLVLVLAGGLGLLGRFLSLSPGSSSFGVWALMLAYLLALASLFCWLPPPLARRAKWRGPLARALWRVVWPERGKEVPFVEVLVADGLTSIARVFFDVALGACVAGSSALVLFQYRDGGPMLDGLELREKAPWPLEAPDAEPRPLLGEAFEQCARAPLPFLAWALPFLIRARQCLISARSAPDLLTRDLHRVNAAKYLSALPIMLFALCHARAEASGPEWLLLRAEDYEALWAMAAVVNSVFSFVWDLVMDWGLLQPAPFGLRPVLLFRGVWGFYHLAITCNLLGRTLWSLRWSPQATLFLGGFFLTSLQQAAEVLRRCLWNVIRVEWECIRRNIHRSDRHFRV